MIEEAEVKGEMESVEVRRLTLLNFLKRTWGIFKTDFSPNTKVWYLRYLVNYALFKLLNKNLLKQMLYNLAKETNITKQEILIHNFDRWDILIILDACRYDIFRSIIFRFFKGELVPALSPANWTLDWLCKIWSKQIYKNIIYISASPFVNRQESSPFKAKNKFLQIIEAWKLGWDSKLLTVNPKFVSLYLKLLYSKHKADIKEGKVKIVAHYLQPHIPYIISFSIAKVYEYFLNSFIERNCICNKKIISNYFAVANPYGSDIYLLSVKEVAELIDENVNQLLFKLYINNLISILKHLRKVLHNFECNVVITSDHGELLGEYGLYFHPNITIPQLRIIPWFTIRDLI